MKKTLRLLAIALIAMMLCISLVSCFGPNADPDDALEALEDNGIKAVKDNVAMPLTLKALGIDDVDTVIVGSGEIDDEYAHITIIYFDDKDDANDAFERVKEYAEDTKDEDEKDWVCKKSGNMIYYGTKAAINAAR